MPHPSSELALLTDLYELRMMQAYLAEGMDDTAVFSLFVRRLPESRNYLLACGLEPVLEYLERLAFTRDDLAYLASAGFSDPFLRSLERFRFTGDVHAVPEGTPVFANEPILEVVAPLPQAQLIETFVLNQIHLQTVVASKAARVVWSARGRAVVDFGARRTHGIDAAIKAARASYIAGAASTSNVLAGRLYGIPVAGTMAHSYVQAHGDERSAFASFTRMFPGTVLLVDTYDTLAGVQQVIDLLRSDPTLSVSAIRLDSGDLDALSRGARRMLDGAGLQAVAIFASSGLDEHLVGELTAAGAPIDGFGVGTGMGTSTDAPALDIVYKLVDYAGQGRVKLSPGKRVLPGRKQVYRMERDGMATDDLLARSDEAGGGRPLLRPVMRAGVRLPDAIEPLESIRARARSEVSRLPAPLMSLAPAEPPYEVRVSAALEADFAALAELRGRPPAAKAGRKAGRP